MKFRPLQSLVFACGLAAALPAFADVWLIQNVRVFDGQRMHAGRSVLVEGASIADGDFRGKAPAGARIIDGKGRTLLPGLIDSHVHAYRHHELPLLFGVTTQIDMFTGISVMQDITRRMQSGANGDQADLYSAGTLATAPGGHGTEYGMAIPTLSKPEEAQAFVDARIAEGSHFIKIVMEAGHPGRAFQSLDAATVKALIDAAHKRGKLAVVHISTLADARTALEAGADGLVHLFVGEQITPQELEGFTKLAHAKKAFIIPTFSVMESIAGLTSADIIGDPAMQALLDKQQKSELAKGYGKQARPQLMAAPKAVVAALRKAGVPLLAGTDAGNAGTQYGASIHHEMLALTQAGLTPAEALAAATSVPAQAFGLPARGRIAKGYKADLLLVQGDPGADIAATRRIVEVWKDGALVTGLRDAQRAKVAQELIGVPVQALPADGRISLFSKEKLASPFGAGWMAANDTFLGGKSTVSLTALDAQHSQGGALQIDASVAPGFAYPFAGLAFMPGVQPMQPANLSGAKVLRFRVRGDGQRYGVSIMSRSGNIPVSQPFTAEAEWREVSLPLDAFKGVDTAAITMISFNAGPKPGAYQFQIADVRLLAE
ncbi:amidohydrolase [Massilia sp. Root351]|jgi:imidazolonepropionase-like amidohydrolase|uniref:CIA30 family protein n=1 Tax=Massilia sp. Root351 TaxID=1736522 RepID=UPI00070E6958|nr:CIA30 family protein [Massilia sp. Root351]KQV90988.1 amidohydrolase [Massilia sp. Root351]